MYCSLSPSDSTLNYPNMSNSNVMKQFACGLLSLNRNFQIMLIRPHEKNFLNTHATQTWFTLAPDTDTGTINSVFVCVECCW